MVILAIVVSALLFLAILITLLFVLSRRTESRKVKDEDKDIYKFDKKPLSKYDADEIDSAGQKAESEVTKVLKELSDKYGCVLFENLCLEDKGNLSVEIDHLLLTRGGLFVIETKGNVGVIRGEKGEKVWIAKKPNGKAKKLKNPVIQTLAHTKFIRKLMDDFYPRMYPIAIFPYADISNIDSNVVFNIPQAVDKIKVACESNKYDDNLFNSYLGKINRMIEKHSITREKHIQNIRERFDS